MPVLNLKIYFDINNLSLDFKKERVEGYINQRKEMVNLQNNREIQKENKKQYQEDSFGSLFR